MQRTSNFPLFLSAALVLGAVQLLGCAAPGPPVSAEAPPAADIARTLEQAQGAYEAEDYIKAGELYGALAGNPEWLSEEQLRSVRHGIGRTEAIIQQRQLETAKERAQGLLGAAGTLSAEGKHEEAGRKLDALCDLVGRLSDEEKRQFEQLRLAVEEATGILPAMTAEEAEEKAEDYFTEGIHAYKAKQYAEASKYLDRALLLDVNLGWWDNRKLRKVHQKVTATLEDLLDQYATAKDLCESDRHAEAGEVLSSVKDTGISLGAEADAEIDKLLQEVEDKLAELRMRQEEQRKGEAADLLAEAKKLVDDGDYPRAGEKLKALTELQGYLTADLDAEFEQLREKVEQGTGLLPGMTAEEAEDRAEECLEAGLDAYDAGDYLAAQEHLDRTALLEEHLGSRDRRKLNKVRSKVARVLEELWSDYTTGKGLYAGDQYAQAGEALRRVEESGISLGAEADREVADLLAKVEAKLTEQREREEQQKLTRVAELLAQAGSLAAEEKYGQADARLSALEDPELAGYVSDAQWAEARGLQAAIGGAAEIARLKSSQQEAEELAARAGELIRARSAAVAKVEAAERAWQEEDFEAAKSLLLEAEKLLTSPELADLPVLAGLARDVQQKLAVVDTNVKLGRLVEEARRLARSDLLAAEKKVLEAREVAEQEGAALTAAQAGACDKVLAAVDEAYGAERRVRSEQLRRLAKLSDRYCDVREPDKAALMLSLVKEAGAGMVAEDYRTYALGKQAAAERAAEVQKSAAEGIRGQLAECREEVKRGDLETALARVPRIAAEAEENLAGSLLAQSLEQIASFLDKEFDEAISTTYPGLREVVDPELAQARPRIARGLAQYYLASNGPELAEPYLNKLVQQRGEYAQWARDRLQGIEGLKVQATQERLLAVKEKAAGVYTLAAELHRVAREGDLKEIEDVKQQLADASLELDVEKGNNALARGALVEAAILIGGVPVQDASPDVVQRLHAPVADRLASLRKVAADLQATQDALAAYDLAKAVAHLQEVQAAEDAGVQCEPFTITKQILVDMLDSVRHIEEAQERLRAQSKDELRRSRARLAKTLAREQDWQRYYEGTKAFFLREPGAVDSLRTALARPGELHPFELAEARRIVEALAGRRAPTVVVADDEQRAKVLYEQAVQAYAAGDKERVSRLLQVLKTRYSHTSAYREHR